MTRAMDVVFHGIMGINQGALEYAIPPMPLKNRIAGRVVHGTKWGQLVEFLINCLKMEYTKCKYTSYSFIS